MGGGENCGVLSTVGMALRRRPWLGAQQMGQRRSAVPTPRWDGCRNVA